MLQLKLRSWQFYFLQLFDNIIYFRLLKTWRIPVALCPGLQFSPALCVTLSKISDWQKTKLHCSLHMYKKIKIEREISCFFEFKMFRKIFTHRWWLQHYWKMWPWQLIFTCLESWLRTELILRSGLVSRAYCAILMLLNIQNKIKLLAPQIFVLLLRISAGDFWEICFSLQPYNTVSHFSYFFVEKASKRQNQLWHDKTADPPAVIPLTKL